MLRNDVDLVTFERAFVDAAYCVLETARAENYRQSKRSFNVPMLRASSETTPGFTVSPPVPTNL